MALYGENKYLFIHIYKCGGNSIRKYLLDQKIDVTEIRPSHISAFESRNVFINNGEQKTWDNIFKFSFVRNPFDWVVSLYEFIITNPTHENYKEVLGMDFETFLSWNINKINSANKNVNGKFSTQTDFLYSPEGKLLVDYVGKIENYQKDFSNILKAIGLPEESAPHINKTENKLNYRDYYNNNSIGLVQNYFKNDLINFNYTFNQ